ncbi:MAG TPA: transporter substrate-binding domain-containing protein [Aquihabitans sp.]|jgi:polar amino acid transport system substrate-binding protein|nr:transporter substrate-binding domain-containing protein [Aquihabitans sp.]
MRHATMRPLLATALAAALLFGTVACGDDDDEGGSGSNGGGGATEAEGGTLTVCSDIPYAPMEFEGEGPRGLQYTGFDIELLDAMAENLGNTLEVIDSDFDGILGNLSAGTCDVVGSSLTITEERQQEVDFTEPYFDADQSLLVKTDGDAAGLEDLAGETIGVQAGTTGETYANENAPDGAEVKSFPDTDGLFGALESGDIAGVLQDLPVNAGRVAEDDSVEVVETFPTDEQYGFAVEKGSDLKAELDEALAAVRESGTYDELYEKYFPTAE